MVARSNVSDTLHRGCTIGSSPEIPDRGPSSSVNWQQRQPQASNTLGTGCSSLQLASMPGRMGDDGVFSGGGGGDGSDGDGGGGS